VNKDGVVEAWVGGYGDENKDALLKLFDSFGMKKK
jgi:hypothetical protein